MEGRVEGGGGWRVRRVEEGEEGGGGRLYLESVGRRGSRMCGCKRSSIAEIVRVERAMSKGVRLLLAGVRRWRWWWRWWWWR